MCAFVCVCDIFYATLSVRETEIRTLSYERGQEDISNKAVLWLTMS